MYNVRWLFRVAREGLDDLVPAVRQAFNDDPGDDRLERVYGQPPRRNILLLAVGGVLLGALLSRLLTELPFDEQLNWGAVILGFAHAALIRRYLFRDDTVGENDFPWLAASLVPTALLLMVLAALQALAPGAAGESASLFAFLGRALVGLTDALGVAAALTIAVAALCYSRNWLRALWDLVLRLIAFKFTVWLTVLILIEIGIVGPIVGGIVESVTGIDIPDWLPETIDKISYAVFMTVVYLAVIGATWTVCRRSFAELLEHGQVDVLATVAQLARAPKKKKKKKKRAPEDAQDA